MKRILAEIEVFEETLMQEAETATFEDAVNQELGWLHDSGMICTSWKEVPLHKEGDARDTEQVNAATAKCSQ